MYQINPLLNENVIPAISNKLARRINVPVANHLKALGSNARVNISAARDNMKNFAAQSILHNGQVTNQMQKLQRGAKVMGNEAKQSINKGQRFAQSAKNSQIGINAAKSRFNPSNTLFNSFHK